MKDTLSERFHIIALQVGGAHYPTVNPRQLQRFGEEIVKECAKIAELKEQGSQDFDANTSVGWYMRHHFGMDK